MPCANKDSEALNAPCAQFLHWELQGLRGMCCKWSQSGLGFTRAYRQRDWESMCEKDCLLVHATVLSLLVWTYTGLRPTACFLHQICVCVYLSVWQFWNYYTEDMLPPGYEVMASSHVRVVYEVVCDLSNHCISVFILNLLVKISSLPLWWCTEFLGLSRLYRDCCACRCSH